MNGESRTPTILVICDYYLPGYKSGGGMRTIVNTVERLSDQFRFLIVTRDHDGKADRIPYQDITYRAWNRVGPADVYYLGQNELHASNLKRIIREVDPCCIYLNSVFSRLTLLTLWLRRIGVFPTTVLAPCGELSKGALRNRRLTKWLYCTALGVTSLFKGLLWKASNVDEALEIQAMTRADCSVSVLADLPARFQSRQTPRKREKRQGSAKFVFLSRISPKKNLKFLIERFERLNEGAALDIFGDEEDAGYVEACKAAARRTGNVRFRGPLPNESVIDKLAEYDFFVLPTYGENFGHVILESLVAGVPVVVSDTTPWNHLAGDGAGFVVPLKESDWDTILTRCVSMDGQEHSDMIDAALGAGRAFLGDSSLEVETRRFLAEACSVQEGER